MDPALVEEGEDDEDDDDAVPDLVENFEVGFEEEGMAKINRGWVVNK